MDTLNLYSPIRNEFNDKPDIFLVEFWDILKDFGETIIIHMLEHLGEYIDEYPQLIGLYDNLLNVEKDLIIKYIKEEDVEFQGDENHPTDKKILEMAHRNKYKYISDMLGTVPLYEFLRMLSENKKTINDVKMDVANISLIASYENSIDMRISHALRHGLDNDLISKIIFFNNPMTSEMASYIGKFFNADRNSNKLLALSGPLAECMKEHPEANCIVCRYIDELKTIMANPEYGACVRKKRYFIPYMRENINPELIQDPSKDAFLLKHSEFFKNIFKDYESSIHLLIRLGNES